MLKPISELNLLDDIEDIADKYRDSTGTYPFDLSHWDPSEETIRQLARYLTLPPPPLAAPYIYPYYVGAQQDVMRRLGFNETTRNCLFAQAGTNALHLATWWLRASHVESVLVLCPSYFPIFYAIEMVGMLSIKLQMNREEGTWRLPKEQILDTIRRSPAKTAVWITNPVYCTGSYFSLDDIDFLDSLIEKGVKVVADECLAINGKELGRYLGDRDDFLGFYSPHKSVCINAIKFAIIIYAHKYKRFFDHWSDVVVGGLSSSNHTAIYHFLGNNFMLYQSAFFKRVEEQRRKVEKILSKQYGSIKIDREFSGHFMMLYAPCIPGRAGNDIEFLEKLVFDTGATLIPGSRNHFSLELGFTFRINLARACPQFFSAFQRMCRYLHAFAG